MWSKIPGGFCQWPWGHLLYNVIDDLSPKRRNKEINCDITKS